MRKILDTTNQVEGVRHCYVFNHGLLTCTRCGGELEGRSGTGRKGKRHYYYVCKTKVANFGSPPRTSRQ